MFEYLVAGAAVVSGIYYFARTKINRTFTNNSEETALEKNAKIYTQKSATAYERVINSRPPKHHPLEKALNEDGVESLMRIDGDIIKIYNKDYPSEKKDIFIPRD